MTKLELAQYGTPNGKITPLQVYDAVKSCGNNQHYTIPENGQLYEDSDRHLSKITTYPDWGLVVMETAPWSSWSQLQTGTAFIQNNDAAKYITVPCGSRGRRTGRWQPNMS